MLVDVPLLELQVDNVIETVTEAVTLYTVAFHQQFSGVYGPARKQAYLHRFLTYLQEHQHSMRVVDLTLADGQQFLSSLVNRRNSTRLSRYMIKRYKSALRTFSRFLYQANLLSQDIFFDLAID